MESRFVVCSWNSRKSSLILLLALRYLYFFGNYVKSVESQRVQSNFQRPHENVHGDGSRSDVMKNAADFVTGGIEFLIEGLMSQEPLDNTPLNMLTNATYDFIVVGAGTAGATIAARLSEIKEATVLLIEAGGEENFIMDIPALANFLQFSNDINWQYKTESSSTYCLGMKNHQCKWPRGRVMGGSSVLNYMIATRGNKKDYDRWSKMGNTGWSWNEVLPYFKKLETMGIADYQNDTRYHNVGGPIHTDYVPYRSGIGKAFVEAGIELGWKNVDYNGAKQTGFSFVQTNTKNGSRHSSNRAYLRAAEKRPNLVITKRSHVTKLLMDEKNKRAIGVEFTKFNRIFRVWSRKEVIVSAGAINSPQLLMLSGIGPEKHLRELGINVLINSPVGENLMDHIAFGGLIFLLDKPVGLAVEDMINPTMPYLRDFLIERKGPITTPGGSEGIAFVNVDNPNDPDDYPNVELFFVSISIGSAPIFRENVGLDEEFWRKSFSMIKEKYTWTIYPMLMRPKSRGKILLRDAKPHSYPRIIANYMSHREDVRLLVKGVRMAIKVGRTRAMRRYGSRLHTVPISGCEDFKYDSDDYWDCAVRSFTMNIYHYSGTCKMGPEGDPTAVVNPRLQVIGISGLRVADASIMPEIPTGHTNIPTHMIAEKLADMVKEDWGYPTDPLP